MTEVSQCPNHAIGLGRILLWSVSTVMSESNHALLLFVSALFFFFFGAAAIVSVSFSVTFISDQL